MDFSKAYNREEFVNFLGNSFLPEDFISNIVPVKLKTQMTYTTEAVKLGSSASLDLVVYEVKHNSKHDARVSLSKEAFRLLFNEFERRALVIFVPQDSDENYRLSLIEITLESYDDKAKVPAGIPIFWGRVSKGQEQLTIIFCVRIKITGKLNGS